MPFLIAFGVAFVLTPVARRVGLAAGLVDRVTTDPLKIHSTQVSVLGGAAVVGAAFLALVARGEHVSWQLVVGVLAVLALGMLDDARPLPVTVRLLGQAGSAVLLVAGEVGSHRIGVAGEIGGVLLVMTCANAVNIVDGQDGLAGGLGGIAALGLAGLAVLASATLASDQALALAGALVGFVLWNVHPTRIFLGNGGAYALGSLLGLLALEVADADGWRGLVASGVCLGVFALELLMTIARRFRTGEALMHGDRLHSYDVVAVQVGSRMKSTAIFWAVGAAASSLGVAIGLLPLAVAVPAALAGLCLGALGGLRLWAVLRVRSSL